MNKNVLAVFAIILVSIAFFIWQDSKPVIFFNKVLNEILRPFEIVLSSGQKFLGFWQTAFLNIKSLKYENNNLRTQNLELESVLVKSKELEDENNFLKVQLSLPQKAKRQVFAAQIIASGNQNNLRSFVIDKGAKDNIKKGMAVISEGETLLGRVSDISGNTSVIQTIFDIDSRIAGETVEFGVAGLIRGVGSNVIFDFVPKSKSISNGELIISSGKDGVFPRGLIIGRVSNVKSSDNQVFQNATIETPVDFSSLDRVFIILN